jgi:glycyl-tRNA synthetase beta chain
MKDHQRYFPVKDKDGKLLPEFIVITDRDSGDGEVIRKGNERVLRARLADANFFWDEDKKYPFMKGLRIWKVLYFMKI